MSTPSGFRLAPVPLEVSKGRAELIFLTPSGQVREIPMSRDGIYALIRWSALALEKLDQENRGPL
jgi:hypothetical protein